MSSDFSKKYVIDDRLACTNEINYSVNQGAQQVTTATFNAVSQGNSSHVYNIACPSENIIVDRRVIWTSRLKLKITGTPPVGEYLVNYGTTEAFSPVPLHQCCTTIQATINNSTVSTNIRDTLPALLRMNDVRELQRFNGLSPLAPDTYKSYADAVGANNNPLGSYVNVSDNDLLPRGAYPVSIGSNLTMAAPQVVQPSPAVLQTTYISILCSEALLISPFIFANPKSNNQGFYGIQTMSFNMNIGDASRVFRSARGFGVGATVEIVDFTESALTFQFLTPHSNLLLPSRNIVPKIRNGNKSASVMVC